MSLTGRLAVKDSLVRQFFEQRFPLVAALNQGSSQKAAIQHMLAVDAIPRNSSRESPVPSSYRRLVGTALDYRLRYYFAITPYQEFVAYRGAAMGDLLVPVDYSFQFFASLQNTVERLQPVRRRLNSEEEQLLAQYCCILALFEVIYRRGVEIDSPLSSLGTDTLSDEVTPEDFLALADPAWVEDLCTLSWDFYEDAKGLLIKPTVLNPTFEGSRDIGGADADLIIDSCLFELKTLSQAAPKDVREAIYQLLGYVLLDYNDQYSIRVIGMWLTRQRHIWRAPVSPFLFSPDDLFQAKVHTEEEVLYRLRELRTEFSNLLQHPEVTDLFQKYAASIAEKSGMKLETLIAKAREIGKQRFSDDALVDRMLPSLLLEVQAQASLQTLSKSKRK